MCLGLSNQQRLYVNLKENLADIKTEMAHLKEIEGDWSTAIHPMQKWLPD